MDIKFNNHLDEWLLLDWLKSKKHQNIMKVESILKDPQKLSANSFGEKRPVTEHTFTEATFNRDQINNSRQSINRSTFNNNTGELPSSNSHSHKQNNKHHSKKHRKAAYIKADDIKVYIECRNEKCRKILSPKKSLTKNYLYFSFARFLQYDLNSYRRY